MIRDARVLQEDFVPTEIQHRHSEMNQLSGALEPLLYDERPENAFLFGPTGAGKTCIARYSLEKLREQVLDVTVVYVNCWQDYSRFRVLHRVLDAVGTTLDIHRQSTPKDELVERLRDHDAAPVVVILDEVDQLADKGVLYDLYTLPNFSMVMIANREVDLFAEMGDRINSRLRSSQRIQFGKYSQSELVSIVEGRVRQGLDPNAIADEQIEQIAATAEGDARVAIGILRAAARRVERDGLEAISESTVREVVPETRDELKRSNIEKLNDDQTILYEIIEEAGEIDPGELYARYMGETSNPKTRRTVRNYLTKMRHYDLVMAEGEKRARTYRTC